MRKKRFVAITLTVLLVLTPLFSGCSGSNNQKNEGISIVCTIFPQYDWVREIIGDNMDGVDLTLLLRSRTDLHSYQPSIDDIVKISTCDLFIYVGGESDDWVDKALKEAVNKSMIVINLLDVLGDAAVIEEILEGMEEESHDDEHEDEENEYDEHVWLSLKNAQMFCSVIADALSSLNIKHSEEYQSNSTAYAANLAALDEEYHIVVNAAPFNTLLFGDRFPFRYMAEDYGITPFAAFPGCSAETEASFDTIVFLASKVDELGLKAIMVTESADQAIARTIIGITRDKNQNILVLDAMQSVSSDDLLKGTTYLSIMESNLNVLKDALS